MRHKHADLIHAWADGAEIEHFAEFYKLWEPASTPTWDVNWRYRIKPVPKPDVVRYYAVNLLRSLIHCLNDGGCGSDSLRLTFDGETGKLKSAEVIK